MKTRIEVTGTRRRFAGQQLLIQVDEKKSNRAFISSPSMFTARPDKLREIADVMHDLADHIEEAETP